MSLTDERIPEMAVYFEPSEGKALCGVENDLISAKNGADLSQILDRWFPGSGWSKEKNEDQLLKNHAGSPEGNCKRRGNTDPGDCDFFITNDKRIRSYLCVIVIQVLDLIPT